MNDIEIAQRLTEVESQERINQHRLDSLEKLTEAIHSQNESITELVIELKHTNENLRDHENRISVIEAQAGKRLHTLYQAVVTALIGGVIGVILTKILTLME